MTPEERREFTLAAAAVITDDPSTAHLLALRDGRKTRIGESKVAHLAAAARANPASFERYGFCVRAASDLLVLDADSADAAAQAVELAAHAEQLGLAPVVVSSGRPGHVHVFVRVVDATQRETLASAASTGGIDVRTGNWVRPPLSVHPGGGHGELLSPTDPHDALERLRRPAGAPAPQPEEPAPVVVAPPPANRRRKALSASIVRVLRDGDGNPDRSVTFQRVITAMVNNDWTLDEAWAELTRPGAVGAAKLQERLRTKGEPAALRYLEQSWTSAQKFCEENPARGDDSGDLDETLDRLVAQVDAVPWPGSAGSSRCVVMLKMIDIAREANTLTLTASVRQLAHDCSLTTPTVQRALTYLRENHWIIRLRRGTGPKATLWQLPAEPRLRLVTNEAGNPSRRNEPLAHPPANPAGGVRASDSILRGSHDAFRQDAFGALGYRVLRHLQRHGESTVAQIAATLGCHPGSVSRLLRGRIGASGLVERLGGGLWRLLEAPVEAALDWVAQRFGTEGASERQRLQFIRERELYRQSPSWGRDLDWWDQWESTRRATVRLVA